MKELIVREQLDPVKIFTEGGIDEVLTEIQKKVSRFEADISTASGRKEIASMARKVASSKTFIDGLGKQLVSNWKKKAKAVDAIRKRARDYLDNLRDSIRQPLTEWEEEQRIQEEKRKAAIQEKINAISSFNANPFEQSADEIQSLIEKITSIEISPDEYFEFIPQAEEIKASKLEIAMQALEHRKTMEKEAAERKAEEARLAAERKRQEEEAAKIRAEQEKIEKEQAKIKAEKERIEREAFERQAKENARAEAEKKLKEETERKERERIAKEKAEEAERKRQEQLKPDREKLFDFANKITQLTAGNLSIESKDAQKLFESVLDELTTIDKWFRTEIKKL